MAGAMAQSTQVPTVNSHLGAHLILASAWVLKNTRWSCTPIFITQLDYLDSQCRGQKLGPQHVMSRDAQLKKKENKRRCNARAYFFSLIVNPPGVTLLVQFEAPCQNTFDGSAKNRGRFGCKGSHFIVL